MRRKKIHAKGRKTEVYGKKDMGKKSEILIDVDWERDWFLRMDT
jgi:hypothetical protein